MPTIRKEVTVPAGGSIVNIIAGDTFEFAPTNTAVQVYAVQDGAGPGEVEMDVTFGNAIVTNGAVVQTFTPGEGPYLNRHLLAKGVAAGGDRMQLKVSNSGAAASNLRVQMDLAYI